MMITNHRQLDTTAVDRLRAGLRGELLTPDTPGYDAARRVWNARVDRRPALIVRCAGTADVIAAVNFAREHELLVAVRGGGHSQASVCDGGLMLDLSPMRGVRVDPARRVADAQAGATWHDLTLETQAFGLAVPGGTVSDVGIAGLTLGGGMGWLGRKYGMTVDNLLAVDLVTADGMFRTASADEEPELFWGLRGGGGNFGVATAFRYRLHPVGPLVTGGLLLWPVAQAAALLRYYRDYMAAAPDELFAVVAFLTAPPAPFVPEALRGAPAVALIVCHCGSLADGAQAVAALRAFGPPVVDQIVPMPFVAVQHLADAATPPGWRYDRRARQLDALSDAVIAALADQAPGSDSPRSVVLVIPLGGAVRRAPAASTATGPREAAFAVELLAAWTDPAEDGRHLGWARRLWTALEPHARPEVNVNFLDEDDEGQVRAAYGPETYQRLVALKDRYDPTNLFRLNHNIRPSDLRRQSADGTMISS